MLRSCLSTAEWEEPYERYQSSKKFNYSINDNPTNLYLMFCALEDNLHCKSAMYPKTLAQVPCRLL